MMFTKRNILLYAVTDRAWLNGRTLKEAVRESLEGGVTMVQLREKELDDERFINEAYELKDLCGSYRVPFIINDRVDIALKVGADGVHVGQSDMEASRARELLGSSKVIGVTAKTVSQAVKAMESGASYLGAGAVFHTATKLNTSDLTLEELKAICAAVSIPVAAIGGINIHNIHLLKGSGISGAAIVSGIFAGADIKSAARALRKAAEEIATP